MRVSSRSLSLSCGSRRNTVLQTGHQRFVFKSRSLAFIATECHADAVAGFVAFIFENGGLSSESQCQTSAIAANGVRSFNFICSKVWMLSSCWPRPPAEASAVHLIGPPWCALVARPLHEHYRKSMRSASVSLSLPEFGRRVGEGSRRSLLVFQSCSWSHHARSAGAEIEDEHDHEHDRATANRASSFRKRPVSHCASLPVEPFLRVIKTKGPRHGAES